MVYAPGTLETDPKKQNMALQQLAQEAAAVPTVAAAAVSDAAGTATPIVDGSAAVGTSAKWAHEDHVHPTDTSRLAVAGGQTITGGFRFQAGNVGHVGGYTVNPSNGNYQYGDNNGTIILTAPASDCAVDLLITNVVGAGSVSFSGFNVSANTGEPFTTTVGHIFIVSIRRINGISTYMVKALQ